MKNAKDLRAEARKLEDGIQGVVEQIERLKDEARDIERNEEKDILNNHKDIVDSFENAGAELIFADTDNSDDERKVVEDDGTLNIVIGKVRGCFICNQDISKSEWNKLARPLIKQFGFKWSDLN